MRRSTVCATVALSAIAVFGGRALRAGDKDGIAALVKEDLRHEVRPGGVNGQPFWNGAARFFMYPPAFDFPADKVAVSNRFEVVDSKGRLHVFMAAKPTASLAPVWEELPTGWTSVMCLAVDKVDDRTVLKGSRTFWKQAPFTGKYPPAACGYAEFAEKAKGWLYAQPAFQKFLKDHDAAACGYWGMTYPSKMIAAIVSALCSGTPSAQDLAAAILRGAKGAGVHTAVETCGHLPRAVIENVRPLVDLWLYDIKGMDGNLHKKHTGVDNSLIHENLRWLDAQGEKIVLRCPMIPGLNDSDANLGALASLADSLKGVSQVDVEPYSPFGVDKGRQLGQRVYEAPMPPPEYANGIVRRLSALTRKKVAKS